MRLELTRRTDLALNALRYLSASGARAKAAELADALGTSTGFVQQAMKPAVDAGWVRSVVGRTGGYTLTAAAAHASVLDVIQASEGPVDDGRCVLADATCPSPTPCALHEAWVAARAGMVTVLAGTPALQGSGARQPGPAALPGPGPQTNPAGSPAPSPTGAPVIAPERT